jgi:hypothetical protein
MRPLLQDRSGTTSRGKRERFCSESAHPNAKGSDLRWSASQMADMHLAFRDCCVVLSSARWHAGRMPHL